MLFNSIDFAIFLPIVFLLYWFIFNRNIKVQNLLILISSYVFYGWWDYRFLSLILFSTLVDYIIGTFLNKQKKESYRKVLLITSVVVNLGFLGFFKYYNFFVDSFSATFSLFGKDIESSSLNIILPVGISFYTFQTLSYTIDIYKRKLTPTKDFIAFSAFVSFFPQLVAGPIERATNLLPQFLKKRGFNYNKAVDGLRQILWGIFKKIVIADNCAEYANMIFNNSSNHSGSTLAVGAVFFSIQIYCDFSGYTDIAIGTSRLFGFNLKRNFNFPYFSRDIAEFWRKWHISLTTWFRDYLYIPLGGSRVSKLKQIRNVFIIFMASGLWHGANWTFVAWGGINAILFIPLLLTKNNRKNLNEVAPGRKLPSFHEFVAMLGTFCLITLTWIFFRAENMEHAITYTSEIFSSSFFTIPRYTSMRKSIEIIILTCIFFGIEWRGRADNYAIEKLGLLWSRRKRYIFYYAIILSLFYYFINEKQFIYFQF